MKKGALSAKSAYSHTGEVGKGLDILKMMCSDYGVCLKDEHFASVVDLLGRSGKLEEAWKLLQKLPNPSVSMYSSLLGACCHFLDDRLGELVAERISELDHQNPAPRIILSNAFADKQRWSDVERLRKIFTDCKNIKKSAGRSWIAAA